MTDAEELRRIADELEIRDLIARAAQVTDFGELSDYSALWTEDVAWELPDAPVHGSAALVVAAETRRATGSTGPGSNTKHVITTLAVRVDGTDTASSTCYWIFFGDTTTTPVALVMGQYDDTLHREPGGWKIARRQITLG